MNVRVTWFFECIQPATRYASATLGWTETLFGFSNLNTSVDDWIRDPDVWQYVSLRIATMGSIYRIVWIRVSDEANPRSFKIASVPNGTGTADIQATTSGEVALPVSANPQVQCALLVDMARLPGLANEHTHHRRFLMRALPPGVINGNVIVTGASAWSDIKRFLDWIANHEVSSSPQLPPTKASLLNPPTTKLGLRYQDPTQIGFQAAGSIAVSNVDPRTIVMTLGVAGTAGVSKYLFKGFPANARNLNRTWTYLGGTPPPTVSSLFGTARKPLENVIYTAPGPGLYRLVAPVYNVFNQYTIIGLRTKKTGRNFRLPRGRVSTR